MIRLRDEQWERIRDHFPEEKIADGRPGRKPIPIRCVLEAVLWILNTGAQWHMLPQSYPNYKTVHRRFQTWCRDEVLRRVLTDVANELRDRGLPGAALRAVLFKEAENFVWTVAHCCSPSF
jgi:transposase